MRKVITALVVSLLVLCPAFADISVQLAATGVLLTHGGTLFPDHALPSGALMQLIWSTVNAYSLSYYQGPGNITVDSNSWILWSGFLPDMGSWSDDQDGSVNYSNADVGGNNIHAGYLYARIFETGSPVVGTWYASTTIYDTSGFGQATNVPPPDPTLVDLSEGPSAFWYGDFWAHPLNHGQVVPEPTTLALGLAGLGLLVYRRLRK